MEDFKKLFDERTEQVGAAIIALALIGFIVDHFAVDYVDDPELFWMVAGAGATVYGAKALILLKKVRDKVDPKDE
jgi:hypothetical protein